MKVIASKNVAEIDLDKNAVYVVKDGKPKKIDIPATGFGEQNVYWQDGKLMHWKVSYTDK